MRLRGTLVVGALVVAAAPAVASAQEEGVFVDPDSPTAKEYAIPLEEARRSAGGAAATDRLRAGERSAPLFGEGVGPPSATQGVGAPSEAPRSARDATRGSAPAARGDGGGRSTQAVPAPARGEGVASRRPAATQASGDFLVVGAIAIGVVALGAAGGLAIRRRLTADV